MPSLAESEREPPFILAVDIGSSSVKAGLYDARARAVPATEASQRHEQRVAVDGTSEEPADEIADAVERAIDAVIAQSAGQGLEVAAFGMDSMASTVLGVDEAGRPVTPVYTYADTRSLEEVARITAHRRRGQPADREGP